MRKLLQFLFLFLIIGQFFASAQSKFLEGYYIDNLGVKHSGLIKNEAWKSNPKKMSFKSSKDASSVSLGLNEIVEFAVPNNFKFLKRNIQIDYSSESASNLSQQRDPEYKRATVFLRVLEEGIANLYKYEGQGVTGFYFSKVDKVILSSIHDTSVVGGEIIPLVYKKYYDAKNIVRENNGYKKLLNEYLASSCSSIGNKDIIDLEYSKNALASFVSRYNSCANSETVSYNLVNKKVIFNVALRTGFLSSKGQIETPTRFFNVDQYSSLKYGFEAELVLPFGNYNFSTFLGYERKGAISTVTPVILKDPNAGFFDTEAVFNYKSSEILFGVRYYNNIAKDTRASLGVGLIFDTRSELALNFESQNNIVASRPGSTLTLSGGIHYKRFGLHGTILLGKDYFPDSPVFSSEVNEFNVMLSYIVFTSKK